jgi:hypothetical protein
MTRKRLFLTASAAAVLAAFNPAFAQDSGVNVNANPNLGVDANVGITNTDINAGANISRCRAA